MKRLDEIEARTNSATEGPWKALDLPVSVGGYTKTIHSPAGTGRTWTVDIDPEIASTVSDKDAEFIAHARTDVPALVAALRAVLDLHAERPYGCAVCEEMDQALPWPCPTVETIRQHLEEDA